MIARSIVLFLAAGLCEIGGGYLVWLWLREQKSILFGIGGGFILFVYGILPTLQTSHFSRVYAAYGGIFILLSLLWGRLIDGTVPDRYDIIGGCVALAGVCIIMYSPRALSI